MALANVRSYTRMEHGRPETVKPYVTRRWIPHPDWEMGQRSWVAHGESTWATRGKAAEAAAETRRASARGDQGTESAAGKAMGGTGKASGAAGDANGGTEQQAGKLEHGYELPDSERLTNPRGKYKSPADHPFFQRTPMSADHIVSAYDDATKPEKQQGMRWYEDGARMAWALGGGDPVKGAGVLSAYSPQTAWPANMYNAARSLAEGRALGPGEGMITGQMQKSAGRVLGGEHPDDVLKAPKTNAFARLLTHGADAPDDPHGRVVIDRHALSIAAGRRLGKADVTDAPIGQERFYEHVADEYRKAALAISERDGEELAPHQLQAITWLRQQRVNTAEDEASRGAGGRGRVAGIAKQWAGWQDYAKQHGLRTELGTTALPPTPITADEARGNSRPVSAQEFHDVATQGRDLLNAMEAQHSPITGLVSNWDSLRAQAYSAAQQPWGGMTIDAHTGEALPDGADMYALSVKPPGVTTISVPEGADEQQFAAAMNEALVKFRPLLEQAQHYLGVFHDDEHGRIDIDPVVVVPDQAQAEAIGAYTHNIGGAYHFSDGDGYWPPHIAG